MTASSTPPKDEMMEDMEALIAGNDIDGFITSSLGKQKASSIESLRNLKDFLIKTTAHISSRITAFQIAENKGKYDLSNVVTKKENSQFLEPRGRFDVDLATEGLVLKGKQSEIQILLPKIQSIVVLPSSTSTKKEGEQLLVLSLSEIEAQSKKKDFIWVLSNSVGSDGNVESNQICSLLASIWRKPITYTDRAFFQSVINQKSFLRCYRGTQEGVLYPLAIGLVFIKPIVFIPAAEISSITAGRGDTGSTRYVDLKVETVDDRVFEFTNIDREELPSIQRYVQSYLELRARQEKKAKQLAAEAAASLKKEPTSSAVGNVGFDDGDDDDEDEDFDPDEEDEEDDDDDSGVAEADSGHESYEEDEEEELSEGKKQPACQKRAINTNDCDDTTVMESKRVKVEEVSEE